jgi:hypothetical protein
LSSRVGALGKGHLDPLVAQDSGSPPARLLGWIVRADDDSGDARVDDRVGAGRLPAVVRARLEADVERRARGIPAAASALLERRDLGVGAAELGVKALADRLAFPDQDSPDHRIGTDPPAPPLGELERPTKERSILLCSDSGHRD